MSRSPFTPGVGLEPRYLAGREPYVTSYRQRLQFAQTQQKNTLVVGLRGVGKSVLLKTFEKVALDQGYLPVLKEVSKRNNNEDELIQSLLADLALKLKGITLSKHRTSIALGKNTETVAEPVDMNHLLTKFHVCPGDKVDKLIGTLTYVSDLCLQLKLKGLVLLFDEFQLLQDDPDKNCYSMSLLLDSISRIQSSTSYPIHAVIAGLPTVVGKMAESKPHVERLFSNVADLGALDPEASRLAIFEPLAQTNQSDKFAPDLITFLTEITAGYPFFIQYFSNEAYENFQHSQITRSEFDTILPEINAKLDEHFYSPRFLSLTTKERAIVMVSSFIKSPFSPTDLLAMVNERGGEISMGGIQQYLLALQEKNIIYKVRRGTYDYAIPLLQGFLGRCMNNGEDPVPVIKDLGQR